MSQGTTFNSFEKIAPPSLPGGRSAILTKSGEELQHQHLAKACHTAPTCPGSDEKGTTTHQYTSIVDTEPNMIQIE
jgi:hypothetical protein